MHQRKRRAEPRDRTGPDRTARAAARTASPCSGDFRADRLARNCTPASRSARLRRQNAIRSSSGRATLGARDEHLKHVGRRRRAPSPAGGDVERDLAPAEDGQPLRGGEPGQGGCHQVPFGGEEGHPGRVAPASGSSKPHEARKNWSDVSKDPPRPRFPGRRPGRPGVQGCIALAGPWPPPRDRRVLTGPRRNRRHMRRARSRGSSGRGSRQCALLSSLEKRHFSAHGTTLALLHRHYITGRILYQSSLGVAAGRRFAPGSSQVHSRHGEDENGDVAERTVAHAEGARQRADAQ